MNNIAKMTDEEALDQFVDSLLRGRKSRGLTEEKLSELKKETKANLVREINRALIYSLPEDKLAEAEALADKEGATSEDLAKLIADSGVDEEKIIRGVMEKFQKELTEKDA